LYGSASRGEDIESSDIDLYVQTGDAEVDLTEYEDSLNRNIELHVEDELEKYPKELRNNIANGIVVYGYLEVL
jgi:predicted nucleotidyltransferase